MPFKRNTLYRYACTLAYLRARQARGHHVRWHGRPIFWDAATIIDAPGEVEIGAGFRSYNTPVPSRISAMSGAKVELGADVGLNYGVEIYAAESVKIGERTSIGDFSAVYDTQFHPVQEGEAIVVEPVSLGVNVWLARMATILPGVTIGDHSVVAAGSVVTSDVPPRSVVAGCPARVVREGIRAADDYWRRAS